MMGIRCDGFTARAAAKGALAKPEFPEPEQTKTPGMSFPDIEKENAMNTIVPVKERTNAMAEGQEPAAEAAIRMLANDLHRLNQSVMRAVDAGVSVELIRSARHHCGDGNWGDLLVPVIVKNSHG